MIQIRPIVFDGKPRQRRQKRECANDKQKRRDPSSERNGGFNRQTVDQMRVDDAQPRLNGFQPERLSA